jgi:hypothetical protein
MTVPAVTPEPVIAWPKAIAPFGMAEIVNVVPEIDPVKAAFARKEVSHKTYGVFVAFFPKSIG